MKKKRKLSASRLTKFIRQRERSGVFNSWSPDTKMLLDHAEDMQKLKHKKS